MAHDTLTAQIRAARLADVAGLMAMWLANARFHAERDPDFYGLSHDAEREMRGYWEGIIGDTNRRAFVAESPGVGLVGCAQAEVRVFRVFARPSRGILSNVWVDPAFRARGIGRRLVEQAVDWLQGQGVQLIVLNVSVENQAAARFYQRLGYRIAQIDLVAPT